VPVIVADHAGTAAATLTKAEASNFSASRISFPIPEITDVDVSVPEGR
jgi:hypothetical protein